MLYIVDNFLSDEDINKIVQYCLLQEPNRIFRTEIPYQSADSNLLTLLIEIRKKVKEFIMQQFKADPIYHDYTMLQINFPEDYHILHADNRRLDGENWVPNHTPHRNYSAGLYLTTGGKDFEGGELEIMDVKYPLKAGQLFAFDSRLLHQVHKIISGKRISIMFWFTNDEKHKEREIK